MFLRLTVSIAVALLIFFSGTSASGQTSHQSLTSVSLQVEANGDVTFTELSGSGRSVRVPANRINKNVLDQILGKSKSSSVPQVVTSAQGLLLPAPSSAKGVPLLIDTELQNKVFASDVGTLQSAVSQSVPQFTPSVQPSQYLSYGTFNNGQQWTYVSRNGRYYLSSQQSCSGGSCQGR